MGGILDRYKKSSSDFAACIKICTENCDNFENSHISHIIFCKIYIVHFYPIIGKTFSVHSPTCHAACIKICTGTFDTFGTFFQKVKNECDFGVNCLHFDTFNKTQSYQKDRKCQKCQKCHVIFFFVPCVRIISGHPHFAFLLHICNSVHFLLPNANRY